MIWIHDLGILYWSETTKKANTEIKRLTSVDLTLHLYMLLIV